MESCSPQNPSRDRNPVPASLPSPALRRSRDRPGNVPCRKSSGRNRYASANGEPPAVAAAIRDHHLPTQQVADVDALGAAARTLPFIAAVPGRGQRDDRPAATLAGIWRCGQHFPIRPERRGLLDEAQCIATGERIDSPDRLYINTSSWFCTCPRKPRRDLPPQGQRRRLPAPPARAHTALPDRRAPLPGLCRAPGRDR